MKFCSFTAEGLDSTPSAAYSSIEDYKSWLHSKQNTMSRFNPIAKRCLYSTECFSAHPDEEYFEQAWFPQSKQTHISYDFGS